VTLNFDLLTSNLLSSYWCPGLHVSTKFKVSTAFSFRLKRRHGADRRTDRQAGCNALCSLLRRTA